MIERKPTVRRDLQTGHVLIMRSLRGRQPQLFKKRPSNWGGALGLAAVFWLPGLFIFGGGAIWEFLRGDTSRALTMLTVYAGLSVIIILMAHGGITHEMGGCGSETD